MDIIYKIIWMRRNGSRCSIYLHSSKNGRCSKIAEDCIGMSRRLDTSTTKQMDKIVVQYGRSSRSSWAKSVWSSVGSTVMWKAIWESSIRAWLRKSSELGGLIRAPWEKDYALSVYVDDIKLDGQKQNLDPMWKILNKEDGLGEPTSFLDYVYLGCNQSQCETSMDIVDNHRTMVESRISARAMKKTTKLGNTEYFDVVLRYGRSCQKVCGTL